MTTNSPSSSAPPVEPARRGAPQAARRSGSSSYHRNVVFWILGALLLAAPTITLPEEGGWLAVKAFALEAVGIVLAVLILSRGEWTLHRVRCALLSAPNLAILGFLIWVGFSAARSELPGYSRYEAMRHLGGGLVYFSVVYGLSMRRHLRQLVGFLVLAGSLAAIVAFTNSAEFQFSRVAGAFRDQQLLAGFLTLIMPVVLVASQADEVPWRRVAAEVATVIIVAGILVTQNRSAWIGSLVALAVLALLYFLYARDRQPLTAQKHHIVIPVLLVALSLGLFLAMSRTGDVLSARAATLPALKQDVSFQWRVGMWSKALRMARDRPLTGWGVGTFPMQQALYYHPDSLSRQQLVILRTGISLRENAHNTYLLMAAELGFPGLALYLGIFGAFFVTALRAVRRMKRSYRQWILIASIAAISGQMVSAVGSPAWEFAECSLFLWLMLGLGMVTAGVGERGMDPHPQTSG